MTEEIDRLKRDRDHWEIEIEKRGAKERKEVSHKIRDPGEKGLHPD